MSTTAPARAAEHAQTDPYALRPEDAGPAPETFRDRLRHLGPGFVLSAAVVGSGELITTTALGAKVGFALLWLVVLSTAVVVVAVWRLRHTGVPARFRTNPWLTAALVVSSAAILCVGVYGVLKTVGVVAD
ncbi:hypothetical protein [Streptomyces rubrogriseus]|uniref:hypothetical protein n=1 Tax=Streptomyces rubrogriseus TaxID=194673 RepID=UPI0037CDF842